jgi:hypothetical protein
MDINELVLNISQEVVEQALQRSSIGSAAGPDGIPAGLLRLLWAKPYGNHLLYCRVMSSLSLGCFSHQWHRAIIHPICKAGSKEYRPISLLSQIFKITERLVT